MTIRRARNYPVNVGDRFGPWVVEEIDGDNLFYVECPKCLSGRQLTRLDLDLEVVSDLVCVQYGRIGYFSRHVAKDRVDSIRHAGPDDPPKAKGAGPPKRSLVEALAASSVGRRRAA